MLKKVSEIGVRSRILRHGKEYTVSRKRTNFNKDGVRYAVGFICPGGVTFDFPNGNTKITVVQ